MTNLRDYPRVDAPQIVSWRTILGVFVFVFLLLVHGSVVAAGWDSQFDHPIVSSAVVVDAIDADGKRQPETVVVGDREGFVRAFDASSGEVLWKQSLDGELGSAPAFHETWGHGGIRAGVRQRSRSGRGRRKGAMASGPG